MSWGVSPISGTRISDGFAGSQEMLGRTHVDFGFAAAGNAMEKDRMESRGLADGLKRAGLILGQDGRRRREQARRSRETFGRGR